MSIEGNLNGKVLISHSRQDNEHTRLQTSTAAGQSLVCKAELQLLDAYYLLHLLVSCSKVFSIWGEIHVNDFGVLKLFACIGHTFNLKGTLKTVLQTLH